MSAQSEVPATTRRRLVQLVPSNEELIDAGFLALLGVIAVFELHSTFAGWEFLVVAVVGFVLGAVIAHLANALSQPVIVLAAMGLAAFFLLGGAIALHSTPGVSALPTGSTLQSLADESVHGWKDLVTTLPKVDGTSALLVLPYILGLFCGLGGFALARRTRASFAPQVAPFVVLVAVILLGTTNPSHEALTAVVFGLVAFGWAMLRSNRIRPVVSTGSGTAARWATSGVLVAVAGLGALFGGTHVPGAGSHPRVVLRSYVAPPLNINNYPSPLSEFRRYVLPAKGAQASNGLADKTLFTVSGTIPIGTPIRFATLDSYNGIVWAATNSGDAATGSKPNSFLGVGSSIDDPSFGPTYTMQVTIDDYDDYWMPTAGAVQHIKFTDPNSVVQSQDFRYNLDTGTGVVSSKLQKNASYALTVQGTSEPTLQPNDALASDGFSDAGDFLKSYETQAAGSSSNPTTQVLDIAKYMYKTGRFTNGDAAGFAYYLPGHSTGRLDNFVRGVVNNATYVGDDEQYAATYALMIQQIGVPARVVVGVESLPADRKVTGADVHAWVEVQLADGSWRAIPTDLFESHTPPDQRTLQKHQQTEAGSIVPPPAQGRPKTVLDDTAQAAGDSTSRKAVRPKRSGFKIPGWVTAIASYAGPPILVLALIFLSIIGMKELRRRRRRNNGPPSLRLAQGWREITDHAWDLGSRVTLTSTRREQARELATHDLTTLAHRADAQIFGAGHLSDQDVDSFWDEVTAARRRMNGAVGRWRRFIAAISLSSLIVPRFGSERA